MHDTTWTKLKSCRYMGDNIPGKAREQLVYLSGMIEYSKAITAALQTWSGFNLIRDAGADGVKGAQDVSSLLPLVS